MSHDVLILGASARAAASSAMRAGLRPRCIDLFADRDLAAACPVERVESARGADGFAEMAERLSPSPWFYAGGLENHPDAVDRIACRHRLWGVGASALRRVRDPIAVAEALRAARIAAPEVRDDPRGLPRDGSWLSKPRASGGGIGIHPLIGPDAEESGPRYYQRRIAGPSFSALFIAGPSGVRLVGIVRQWIGGVAGRPFAYRGGIGPCRIGEAMARRLPRIGDVLATAFGLVGWFGVDYVRADGIPWPVEVNPRYTASVEIHELATGRALLLEHRDACEGVAAVDVLPRPMSRVAKWIVYARRPMIAPEIAPDASWVADIPVPGTRIGAGEPVLTLMAIGADAGSCRSRLRRLRALWSTRLKRLKTEN